ncbi:MAG: hypothetical protein ACR2JK_14920 [Geodermatophilaceae bacterium]
MDASPAPQSGEADLLATARGGDADAFEQLVAQYRGERSRPATDHSVS